MGTQSTNGPTSFPHIPFLLALSLILACGADPQPAATPAKKPATTPIQNTMSTPTIDWQGHRGARGLLPENTIPAFLKALEYPIQTLELDVVVSQDQRVILSHEPWFSEHICTKPNGQPVTASEAQSLKIYEMDYATIQTYDCGQRGNDRFPEQQPLAATKPELREMVRAAEAKARELQRPLPYYNIELKTEESYYGRLTPAPAAFVQLVLGELDSLGILPRVTLQSFDMNILEAIHQQNPKVTTAQLIENTQSLETNLARLSFQPDIYSPYYETVTRELVEQVHARQMKLIPWTVNQVEDMRLLMELEVDGIITDYPDRIEAALGLR